jgi:hypothetical protein
MIRERFWETCRLDSLTEKEWEMLCDGCARCCLLREQDDETGAVMETCEACRLLDIEACRCKDYKHRHEKVPDCVDLRTSLDRALDWLPDTCAYYRLANGRELPEWHPLLTGDPKSVHRAGISVRGWAVPEEEAVPDD